MTFATGFARCRRCRTVSGIMRFSEAKASGWLPALLRTCRCGASVRRLEPATAGEGRRAVAANELLEVLLVPDNWPGADP